MKSSGSDKRIKNLDTQSVHGNGQLNNDGNEPSEITRRTFCNELLLTSTGLVLAAKSVVANSSSPPDTVLAYPPMKIEGAEKLMPGSSLYFYYPTRNDPAVLICLSEGEYAALSRKCSHAGCSVEFDGGKCLKCPCHLGQFDARLGYVMYGPPKRPLDQIVLQMRAGGQVWATGKSIGKNDERFARNA